jgi:signal transduction histidine kinase
MARLFFPPLASIVLIGLLTVFVICMSIAITRTITHSVKVLEDATRRIAEGELDIKVDVKGSNEIISLASSLNKMRNALKEDDLRRSRFIMGITHDLQTPLALIKGYAEAIEDGVAVAYPYAAAIIVGKADQLEGMINDLIDFVRMDTGEWRARLDTINLTGFLQNMATRLRSDVDLLRHTLIHEISLPENVPVQMDEGLALRAFENLMLNAVRHTPAGSVIRFSARLDGNAVELAVSDNGPGIDNADLPHVFEMFYRGSSSRREQGMGLGLSVVKWVAGCHGWSVSASSEKGKGACFTVTIPLGQLTMSN